MLKKYINDTRSTAMISLPTSHYLKYLRVSFTFYRPVMLQQTVG